MACRVWCHAARIELVAGQVDERPNTYQGGRDFTARIEDLAVTDEQGQHPAATRTGVSVWVPRAPPCDRERSTACRALQTSMTGTNGGAWPRRAVSARSRFIMTSDAVRAAGRAMSERRASSTVLVRATPAIARVDRQRRERPVRRGSPDTGHRRRVGPLPCAYVIGVAFSVATSGAVAVVREGMLTIPSWVAAHADANR